MAYEDQPVPENVRRTWPGVHNWTWLSPLRLRGEHEHEHEHVPGAAYLVVDAARTDALGQAISSAQAGDADYVRETYAELRMALMRNIGRRVACLDATPICHEADGRCVYCGLQADEHELPRADGRPQRQAVHLSWPGGGVTTTAEAEAAIYVELEAMNLGDAASQPAEGGVPSSCPSCGTDSLFITMGSPDGLGDPVDRWRCMRCGHDWETPARPRGAEG